MSFDEYSNPTVEQFREAISEAKGRLTEVETSNEYGYPEPLMREHVGKMIIKMKKRLLLAEHEPQFKTIHYREAYAICELLHMLQMGGFESSAYIDTETEEP